MVSCTFKTPNSRFGNIALRSLYFASSALAFSSVANVREKKSPNLFALPK
jgi:hypothetical protein